MYSSPTARAADNKREEFRKYLERGGVTDLLTRALVDLYEEADKPDDPIRYICNILKQSYDTHPKIDALMTELDEARSENQRLREDLANLRSSSSTQSYENNHHPHDGDTPMDAVMVSPTPNVTKFGQPPTAGLTTTTIVDNNGSTMLANANQMQ